jgi:hypothetical protein
MWALTTAYLWCTKYVQRLKWYPAIISKVKVQRREVRAIYYDRGEESSDII